MNKKGGICTIKGETFPYDVLVCLGVTKEDILKYCDKHYVDALTPEERNDLVCDAHGKTYKLQNRAFILWLKEYPKGSKGAGWLAHEIFHTADLMLRGAGLTLSNDSDETFAYQIDWLTRHIYAAFKL